MTTEVPPRDRSALRALLSPIAAFAGRHVRGFLIANIVAQAGIIVTGGAVRLTGSGLGCSTWPQCEPGQFAPVWVPEMGLHPYIEFGNRTLTGVLTIVALGVALAVWNTRRDLRWWGLVPLIGVIAQAVLGGVTVLTGLNPVVVAPHFLISAALVWQAVWLTLTHRRAPRREGRCAKKPLRASTLMLWVLLILGTLTTGAGPHSGDADATERLGLDPAALARVHALTVWAFVVVIAYLGWRIRKDRSTDGSDTARRSWLVLVIVTLAQGVIGYVQYLTDLPVLLVGLHLAGAAGLTAAHAWAHYSLRRDREAVRAAAARAAG